MRAMRTALPILVLACIANAYQSSEELSAEETDDEKGASFPPGLRLFEYVPPEYNDVLDLVRRVPDFNMKIERILAVYKRPMGGDMLCRVVYQYKELICSLLFDYQPVSQRFGYVNYECSPLLRYPGNIPEKSLKTKKVALRTANRAATRKPHHLKTFSLRHWEDDSSSI